MMRMKMMRFKEPHCCSKPGAFRNLFPQANFYFFPHELIALRQLNGPEMIQVGVTPDLLQQPGWLLRQSCSQYTPLYLLD